MLHFEGAVSGTGMLFTDAGGAAVDIDKNGSVMIGNVVWDRIQLAKKEERAGHLVRK